MLASVRFSDTDTTYSLMEYLDLNRVAGLLVLRDGQIVMERYRLGNTETTRWMSMSIAKSITSTLIGAALRQGRIASLDDPVTRYLPSLAESGYDGASVRDILRMVSGVRWDETYTDPTSDRRRLLEAQLSQAPGAALAVMRALPRAAPPGTVYTYNTGETQVAAEVLTRAVGQPLSTYLAERIWERMGMEADAYWWLDAPGGTEIGGSGFSATLRDYGRLGLFLLQNGVVAGDTILPPDWLAEATSPKRLADGTEVDYGYLWWTGTRPASIRDRSYVAEGLYGQFLYVNPAARVVIVVWSARDQPTGSDAVSDWAFFEAVADSLR
jgi:CubicO group peptidase (beta-lactamase class C family)